jgi:uncharacterized protein YqjF (DUF2071 family)
VSSVRTSSDLVSLQKVVVIVPQVSGVIKRRLLINFKAAPEVVSPLLPDRFRPKLHEGKAVVGICLIRLEHMRPSGLPQPFGMSSENAAHRIAVEWEGGEGVFVPRRDTDSLVNQLIGGRLFPGEQHDAKFSVQDEGGAVSLEMRSSDGEVSLKVVGREAPALPSDSIFNSIQQASQFFEKGEIGYSATQDSDQLEALALKTEAWSVDPFEVDEVYSSFFSDMAGVEFDHALVMRDIPHRWERV